ncbi:MAG: hypothetical protein M3P10_06390 [Actinomycetota bacterium]|nr:hypothetical protein [Actinomycetota bacterium]
MPPCPICARPELVFLVGERHKHGVANWRIAHELQESGVEPFCDQLESGVARKVGRHVREVGHHFREHVTAR